MSWTKLSMAMKPLGERSVLDERFNRKFITVSPMLMLLIELTKSPDFLSLLPWDEGCL